MTAWSYFAADLRSHILLVCTASFLYGCMVAGWHTPGSMLLAFACYVLLFVILQRMRTRAFVVGVLYYALGLLVGRILHAPYRQSLLEPRCQPWTTCERYRRSAGLDAP